MSESEGARVARRAEADAAEARNVYETFRDDLNALLAEVRSGETARAKRLRPVVSELARAVARMGEREERRDGARGGRDRAGGRDDLSGASLDLDAARNEVCRRLARLRAAG